MISAPSTKLPKLAFYFILTLGLSLSAHALEPGWGTEPVETLSETRARVCLNGLWHFAPDATQPSPAAQSKEWGLIHVPGAWLNTQWSMQIRKSIHEAGEGERWKGMDYKNEFTELDSAWYHRELHVPADWAGSAILLDLHRVSTDAVIHINGEKAGEVFWPNGQVDISEFVTPGQVAQLSIQVFATASSEMVLNFMATADSQVTKQEAKLNHRGIIGEVFLLKRPKGGIVEDVFIKTSVRKSEMELEVTLDGLARATELTLDITAYDQDGQLGFQAQTAINYDPSQESPIQLSAPWDNAKLWDFGEPNLYTLKLKVSGEGIDDTYAERFGFREFWIDGRQFYLNNRPVNLRPVLTNDGRATGNAEIIRAYIRRFMEMGHNVGELWPEDHLQRGGGHFRKLWKEIADEEGFGLIATLPRSNTYIMDTNWRNVWAERRADYARDVVPELKDFRNHPSVLYWVNSGNFFGHNQDQNPRELGRKVDVNPGWHDKEAAGLDAISIIKEMDPTRPVATHQGAQVGDVYMTNFYLNMLPLQDRMEWLSDYVENGTMPFMPVEMGTPLDSTFKRGRNGFGGNARSEPLMTEFLAIYQGPHAYEGETAAYRADISRLAEGGTAYGYSQNLPSMVEAPTFQELQVQFGENTYKAWRSWGHSAGMIAWANAHGWSNSGAGQERVSSSEPFVPGHRGTWLPSVERFKTKINSVDSGWKQFPAGDNLIAHVQPTLAWIAGGPEAFTERSHNFASGSDVTKQVVLINDGNYTKDYHVDWAITLRGKVNQMDPLTGKIDASSREFLPIQLPLPTVDEKIDGTIEMRATIGDATHSDSFDFRIFPDKSKVKIAAELIDPKGLTTQMFKDIGVQISEPQGAASLTIYGRQSLGANDELPESAIESIRNGGTALVMIQDREWYENLLGFRIADPISRQLFPVDAEHPTLAGLDARDLSNWNGEATLIDAYPDLTGPEVRMGAYRVPYHGWRWGSRGAVSSAMMEKPHHSAWTPILQGEFDMAYSPLMELSAGQGRVILCSLDLEDLAAKDPAAEKIAKQILEYATTPQANPTRPVYYHGDEATNPLLDSLGLNYERSRQGAEPGLLVVGSMNGLSVQQLRKYAERGWNVLVLPQASSAGGLKIKTNPAAGTFSHAPDWPEARGLSISELRTRSNTSLPVLAASEEIEIAAGGLLGRIQTEGGSIIFAQIDPTALDTDKNNYLRYTRWRFTRALSQLIANLGGSFQSDLAIFNPVSDEIRSINLAHGWNYVITEQVPDPNVERHPDPNISDAAKKITRSLNPLTGDVKQLEKPDMLPEFKDFNGEAVLQYRFDLPESLRGQDLELSLGAVDDVDNTFVNGRYVGGDNGWNKKRKYNVPAKILKDTDNVITVRMWDNFGGGGMSGNAADYSIGLPQSEDREGSVYHPDYVNEFKFGDDPYRYYRW